MSGKYLRLGRKPTRVQSANDNDTEMKYKGQAIQDGVPKKRGTFRRPHSR